SAAVQTLVAAIEVHPGDVEWEPLERRVTLGEDPAPDQVRWTIHDLRGVLIDCSANLEHLPRDGQSEAGWRVRVRRVRAGKFDPEPVAGKDGQVVASLWESLGDAQHPGTVILPPDRTHHGDGLVLTVALAEEPAQ